MKENNTVKSDNADFTSREFTVVSILGSSALLVCALFPLVPEDSSWMWVVVALALVLILTTLVLIFIFKKNGTFNVLSELSRNKWSYAVDAVICVVAGFVWLYMESAKSSIGWFSVSVLMLLCCIPFGNNIRSVERKDNKNS